MRNTTEAFEGEEDVGQIGLTLGNRSLTYTDGSPVWATLMTVQLRRLNDNIERYLDAAYPEVEEL